VVTVRGAGVSVRVPDSQAGLRVLGEAAGALGRMRREARAHHGTILAESLTCYRSPSESGSVRLQASASLTHQYRVAAGRVEAGAAQHDPAPARLDVRA